MLKVKKPVIILAIIGIIMCIAFFTVKPAYDYFMRCMYPIKYEQIVKQASKKYSLEPEFIFAVIKAESKFDPDIVSYAGAIGLMQITPETFSWLQKQKGLTNLKDESSLLKPKVNIEYGSYFLRILLDEYQNKSLALAGYNAGRGVVNEWLKNEDFISEDGQSYNIPYEQTRTYIEKVLSYEQKYKEIYYS